MARPADRSTWPKKGDRAGRDWADPSVWEAEAERLRQEVMADHRRRSVERMRRLMAEADAAGADGDAG